MKKKCLNLWRSIGNLEFSAQKKCISESAGDVQYRGHPNLHLLEDVLGGVGGDEGGSDGGHGHCTAAPDTQTAALVP